jgi:hypothetical protein
MYQESPFHYLTRQWLEAFDQMNLATLQKLTNADFSNVTSEKESEEVLLQNYAEWLSSVQQAFNVRKMLGIQWRSELKDYRDIQAPQLACSMFTLVRQIDTLDLREKFDFSVTLVWRFIDEEWKASRWHASLFKRVPGSPPANTDEHPDL